MGGITIFAGRVTADAGAGKVGSAASGLVTAAAAGVLATVFFGGIDTFTGRVTGAAAGEGITVSATGAATATTGGAGSGSGAGVGSGSGAVAGADTAGGVSSFFALLPDDDETTDTLGRPPNPPGEEDEPEPTFGRPPNPPPPILPATVFHLLVLEEEEDVEEVVDAFVKFLIPENSADGL